MVTDLITRAYAFSMQCHGGQLYDTDHPYIWHVLDVARRLRPLGAKYEIVGVLHDTIEDTDTTLAEIESLFGAAVAAGVEAMTRREGERYFKEYLPRVMENDLARVVKFADSTDNLFRTHLIRDPEYRQKKVRKFTRVLTTLDPLLPREIIRIIRSFALM